MSDVVIAAIASAAIAAAGALGGVVLTQWFTEKTRSNMARERTADRRAEREAEHRTWQRDRRADAYANLLKVANLTTGYVWTQIFELREGRPTARDVAPPTTEQFTEAMALVNVVGSAEIMRMVRVWHGVYTEQVQRLNAVRQNPTDAALRRELDELEQRQGKALTALGNAMRADLDRTPGKEPPVAPAVPTDS